VRHTVFAACFFVLLLGVWQLMVWSGRWSPVLLPAPMDVALYLRDAATDG